MKKNLLFVLILMLAGISVKAQTSYTFQNDSIILNCGVGGILYNPGGPGANYGNNQTFLFTVCSNSTIGESVAYDFISENFGAGDYVCVYDGSNVNAPLLDCYNSVNPTPIDSMVRASSSNTSGCLTFQFYSDAALSGNFAIELYCVYPCQQMSAEIAAFSHPVVDTFYVDVCNGDSLSLTANGIFLENNLNYNQTNNNVSYYWNVGSLLDTAITFSTLFPSAGFYPIELTMEDSIGCKTINEINLAVRYLPLANYGSVYDSIICLGSTVDIFDQVSGNMVGGNIIFGDTIRTSNLFSISSDAQYIPDDADNTAGNGITTPATYPINVTGFIPGSVITSGSQIIEICLDIEHSYIGDIDIVLVAPNGTQMHLVNMNPPGGPSSDFGTPVTGVNPLSPGIPDTYCWSPTSTNPVIGQNSNFGTKVPPATYQAFGNWNNFIGSPVNGVWTIQVFDDWGGDDGNIFGASFEFDPIFIPDADSFFVSYDVDGFWDANPNIISSLNQNTIQYTANNLGADVLYYNATNNFTCVDRDTLNIWVQGFEVVATPSDTTVCTSVPVQLNAEVVGTPPACVYTFNLMDSYGDGWNGNTLTARIDGVVVGTYTINSGSNATFTLSVPGNSTLQVNYNGGGSWQYEVSYNVVLDGVIVHSAGSSPPIGIAYTNTCGGAYTYSWTPATDLNNSNISNPISTLTGGSQTYIVAVSNINNCTYYDTVTVAASASFEFSAGGDTTICFGDTVQLHTAGGAISYAWTPNNGTVSDTTSGNPFVYPSTNTTYTVKADSTGCSQFANILVKVSNIQVTSMIKTNATCGVANGGLIIFANGGSGPLSFVLDGGTPQTNGLFTNLYGGNHLLEIFDGSNCPYDTLITLGGGAPLIIDSVIVQDAGCANDGSIQILLLDTNLIVTYTNVTTGVSQSSNKFTGLAGGTYTISISDGACPAVDTTIVIAQSVAMSLSVDSFNNVSCFNNADGSIYLSATGGTASFTYSIDGINFQPSGIFTALDAGTYLVHVHDTGVCQDSTVVIINEPDSLQITNLVVDSAGCFGFLGNISFDALGGTAPYTYSIDGVPTFGNANSFNVAAGLYSIQIKDSKNCLSSIILDTIFEPSALVAVVDSFSNANCGVADGAVYVSVSGGSTPYTYNWSNGSSVVSSSEDLTNMLAGIYTLSITDANGCITQVMKQLYDNAGVDLTVISSDSVSCFGASDATVVLQAQFGTLPYSFTLNGGTAQTDSVFTNVSGGMNTFLVTDSNGCSFSQQIFIYEPASLNNILTVTNVTCNNASDGKISIATTGGNAPYFYALNTSVLPQGSNVFNNLNGGTYTAFIADSQGCIDSVSNIVITMPDTLIISNVAVVNVSCGGANDGSITVSALGGTVPYKYSLNGGTPQNSNVFANLSGGAYNISVTDSNNCPTATAIDSVGQPTQIILSLDSTKNVNCFGGADAYISFSATGGTAPYSYSIDGGTSYSAVHTYASLTPGTYSLIIRDSNNCTSTSTSVVITQPALLNQNVVVTDESCFGVSDGSLKLTSVVGGTAPYMVSLDGATAVNYTPNMVFSNLTGGSYSLSVVDAKGCESTKIYKVKQPAELILSKTGTTDITCFGLTDGTVSLSAIGGTPGYNYMLNGVSKTKPNSSPVTYNNLAAGTYPVYVFDSNFCSDTLLIDIIAPAEIVIDSLIQQRAVSCFGANDAALIVYASGGYISNPLYGDYTYDWTPSGGTDHKVGNLSPGVHTVVVTDDNGCSTTSSYTISGVDPIIANIIPDTSEISMGDTVQLAVNVQNAVGPLSYSWSPTNGLSCTDCSNPFVTVYNDIVYTIMVTDTNGCSNYNYTESYVFVDDSLFYFIPNSFTPNQDGINDNFEVFGQDIQSVSMMVFNRWGLMVFMGNNQFQTWNGKYQGSDQPGGVYTYTITITFLNGATVTQNGSLTLIR